MDNINGLPDDLLVKILLFVPTKVAVSTAVLSKRWEFLWMLLPKLEFICPSQTRVGDFINRKLPLHRAPVIEVLRLDVDCYLYVKPEDVKRWVEIAVSRSVRELEIVYRTKNKNIIPSSFLSCKSLVTLKLRYMTVMDVPSTVCLPSLKNLQLESVELVDGKSLQQILSGCPVLEDLSVQLWREIELREFTIIIPSLQSLSLFLNGNRNLDGYEIDTPSLEYLKLVDWTYKAHHYSLIKKMPKLREAYVDVRPFYPKNLILGSFASVKRLTICCSKDEYGDGFVFNQLEHLNLCVKKHDLLNLLGKLLKNSPKLRVLDISVELDKNHWDELNGMVSCNLPDSVPECLLSSLQTFKWSRYVGRPRDRDIALYILKNACHLKTATFLALKTNHVPHFEMIIEELTLSPRASSTCKLSILVED